MVTSSAYCIYVYAVDDRQSTETEEVMNAMFKKTMTAAVMAAVVGCGGFYASAASAVTLDCIESGIPNRKVAYVEHSKPTFIKLNPFEKNDNPHGIYTFTIKVSPVPASSSAVVAYYKYTLPDGKRPPTKELLRNKSSSSGKVDIVTTPLVRKNSANIVIWGDLRVFNSFDNNFFWGHCR